MRSGASRQLTAIHRLSPQANSEVERTGGQLAARVSLGARSHRQLRACLTLLLGVTTLLALGLTSPSGAAALPSSGGTSAGEGGQPPTTAAPETSAGAPAHQGSTPGPAPTSTPAAGGSPLTALSNELTLTTWASPEVGGWIHVRPGLRSRRLAPISLLTSDGFPEVYVLLDEVTEREGREWVKVRVPGRPNGRTGWMLRELLGGFHHTHWRIVVNLAQHLMHVYYAGRLLRVFPVGVGKPSTPTPAGHFWVRERFKVSNPRNLYWPYALGTSDYSTLSEWPGGGVVGIHGPFGEPQRIPGDPSHGCIRMLAPDIAWLGPRVSLGTPVDIVQGPR
jgi:hypothetical protein